MNLRSSIAVALAFVIGSAGAALSNGGAGDHDRDWRAVHIETILVNDDNRAVTVTMDKGRLLSRDPDARTLTVRRADGVDVTVAVWDGTRIWRDGETVTLSDLDAGDKVKILRVERPGDERPRLMKVFAWSGEYHSHR